MKELDNGITVLNREEALKIFVDFLFFNKNKKERNNEKEGVAISLISFLFEGFKGLDNMSNKQLTEELRSWSLIDSCTEVRDKDHKKEDRCSLTFERMIIDIMSKSKEYIKV